MRITHGSFAEWLTIQEAIAADARTEFEELPQAQRVLMLVRPDDLVEFGRETQYQGEKVRKLGFVDDIRRNKVLVRPIHDPDQVVRLDPTNLYEADLDKMPAAWRQQIAKISGDKDRKINFWRYRTERQHGAEQAEEEKAEEKRRQQFSQIDPGSPKITSADVSRVRAQLFGDEPGSQSGPEARPTDPLASIFAKEPERQPLARMVQRRGGRSPLADLLGGA